MIEQTKLRLLLALMVLSGLPRTAVLADEAQAQQERLADAGRQVGVEPVGVAPLVEAVLSRNQQLASVEQQIAALEQRALQAAAWKDPTLGLAYLNAPINSLGLDETPMSGVELTYSQTIPFFGKTQRRGEVARNRVEEKRWELEEKRSALRSLVKKTYYSLGLTRQLKQITSKHISLVASFIESVRFKYEAGSAGQHELLRLTVLEAKLSDDLADYDERDARLTAVLNAALHRDVETPIATPTVFHPRRLVLDLAELLERARDSRPVLKQLAEQRATFRLASELASFEALPDVTAWTKYRYREPVAGVDNGDDFVGVGVTIPLPLFYAERYKAAAAEHRASAAAAERQRLAAIDDITAALKGELARLARATEKAAVYEQQLLPDAKQTLDATFAAYQVDRADFASLYQAEFQLLELDRALRRAQAANRMAIAELERLVGADLEPAP